MLFRSENLETKSLPARPDGLIQVTICKKSGKIAVDGLCNHDPRGSMVYTEYFVKGSEPTESCDNHIKITVCKDSGALATENCPAESLEEHVYINTANIPSTISPNAGNPEESAAILKNSEDLTYIMPETLKDNYCPIHTEEATLPPVDDPTVPGIPIPMETDPATEYNEFFGPNVPSTPSGVPGHWQINR